MPAFFIDIYQMRDIIRKSVESDQECTGGRFAEDIRLRCAAPETVKGATWKEVKNLTSSRSLKRK